MLVLYIIFNASIKTKYKELEVKMFPYKTRNHNLDIILIDTRKISLSGMMLSHNCVVLYVINSAHLAYTTIGYCEFRKSRLSAT